jgi:hypothetical protein
VLPFDHRATFSKTMFGWAGPLTPEQTAEIVDRENERERPRSFERNLRHRPAR